MGIQQMIEDKKRYRRYKARVDELPPAYRTATEALARYVMHTGPSDGGQLMPMLEDLVDLFEQSAADRIPVREVVGDDVTEFAEAFKRNYGQLSWLDKEQQRLADAITRAEQEQGEARCRPR
ncbi:DUF1048 domain-containing protein [Propionibacteriaceae bacterium Y2011]